MLKLFKISYFRPFSEKPVIRYIESEKQSAAVQTGMPKNDIGEEQNLDSIMIECLCEVDEILNCTSLQ